MSGASLHLVSKKFHKRRKRTKKLLCDITEQIEFYFSNANLYRDKYLLELTGPDGKGFVPISVLFSFNCLKEINATEGLIQKAVRRIPFLQLSEDKKMVRRKLSTIEGPPVNIDHCTIYVESLPLQATVQWLKELCRKVGPVRYISLPRYKSGSIKGYAFIEFACAEDAIVACSVINSPPKNFFPKLPPDLLLNTTSSNIVLTTRGSQKFTTQSNCNSNRNVEISLSSNVTPNHAQYNVSTVLINHGSKLSEVSSVIASSPTYQLDDESASTSFNIQNLPNSENSMVTLTTTDHMPSVKSKITCVNQSNRKRTASIPLTIYTESEDLSSSKVLKENIQKVKSEIVCVKQTSSQLNQVKQSSKRNRKRKHRIGTSRPNGGKDKQINLHAYSKLEWMELKRSYLRQQRENFGKVKSILQKWPTTDSEPTSGYIKRHIALNDDEDMAEEETGIFSCNQSHDEASSFHTVPVFVPGVIASLSSLSPSISCSVKSAFTPLPCHKKLKSYFSQYGGVAYVDVKAGSNNGFIRFKDTSSAQLAIMEEKKFGLRLLTGVEEESYWDSLLLSRQQKRSRERKKISGKDKLILQAEHRTDLASKRHIKFNTDF